MKLKTNTSKQGLQAGDKQVGLRISLCSNVVAEVTAHTGFDWALIDMEHTPNDYLSVLGQLQAFASSDTTAVVRVEWNDAVAVKRLLDLGAPGILFPMIGSVAEAEGAVAATRYPPDGIRGFSGATRASKFGQPMAAEVWDLIKPAARKLMAKGVPVGTLVLDPEFAAELLAEGFTFVACGTDASLLAKASDALLASVKSKIA